MSRLSVTLTATENLEALRYNQALDLCEFSRPLFFATVAANCDFLDVAAKLAVVKLIGQSHPPAGESEGVDSGAVLSLRATPAHL